MREIQLNMYHALALGAVMYWLGAALTRKLPALRRFCVPAPLVGGLCFALFNTLLYASGLAVITFDETLETVFMILFFTTVGFTVSIPMLVKSGRSVMLLLALSIVIILLQNAVGSGVMALMGKNPLYGLGCGSISMIGGPGTAAAIGPDLDAAGAVGGTTVAVAAATFGLIFGSVLGGPIARHLIVKNHLREELPEGREHEEDADDAHFTTHSNRFVLGFLMLAFCVGLGSYVTTGLTKLCGFNFPAYIGPMLVAVLFFSILVVFPLMGRNYDAAMITAGFIGFGMGATSNAMANMQAVARRYGPSPSAYFMIPMVGGLFNDFFNAAIIALSIGLLS